MKYNGYKIIFIFLLAFIFVPKLSYGAEFIASSPAKNINPNDQFEVSIILNTEGKSANAIGGTIAYPANLLELKEIRDGDSVVNFWVDKPADTANGVVFSGITPGGYQGLSGPILSLVFIAKENGQGDISVLNGQILANDGVGSPIPFTVSDFKFSIVRNGQTAGTEVSPIKDTIPPESFLPEVGQDPNLFLGKWFVAFAAEDKGSGIDRYEVKEAKYRILDFSKWNAAESPYLLSDQDLESYIYVRAFDKAGNERVETVKPQHPLPFYENLDNWFILIIIIVFLLLYKIIVWKKQK